MSGQTADQPPPVVSGDSATAKKKDIVCEAKNAATATSATVNSTGGKSPPPTTLVMKSNLDNKLQEFKADPEKMQAVGEFLADLLVKAEKEAEVRRETIKVQFVWRLFFNR